VPLQFAPETITAYEIGSKNSFFDKRLTANLSAYLYNDKGMQFQAEDLINFQGGVDNIPKVQVYGLEGEIAALMPAGLRFDGNFAWEKGKITSHFLALDNVAGSQANAIYLDACNFTCYGDIFAGTPALNALRHGCLPRCLWQRAAQSSGVDDQRGLDAYLEPGRRLHGIVAVSAAVSQRLRRRHDLRQDSHLHGTLVYDGQSVL